MPTRPCKTVKNEETAVNEMNSRPQPPRPQRQRRKKAALPRTVIAAVVVLLCLALLAGLVAFVLSLFRQGSDSGKGMFFWQEEEGPETFEAGPAVAAWNKNSKGVVFSSDGGPVLEATLKGMDVSYYQGEVDWAKAKAAGIEFAMLRCGYGREWGGVDAGYKQDDAQWRRNVAECRRLGIPFGAYLYSYATSPDQARQEAAHAARLLGLTPPPFEELEDYTDTPLTTLDFPFYYDLEDKAITGLTPAESAEVVAAFFDELQKYGYTGPQGIYASLNWVRGRLQDPGFDKWRDTLWIARFSARLNYEGEYYMWQSSYTVPGDAYGVQSDTVDIDFVMQPLRFTGLDKAQADVAPVLTNDTRRTLLWMAQKNDRVTLLTNEPAAEEGGQKIFWATSNKDVATVDKNGQVRARGEGSCTITATRMDGRLLVSCTVQVGALTVPVYVTGALAGQTGAEGSLDAFNLADVAALRDAAPQAILLDVGASLQGTWSASLTGGSDMAEAFGKAGYDVHAIGAADLAFGVSRLRTAMQAATGVTLAANLLDQGQTPLFDRHLSWSNNRITNGMNTILTRAGHKIGVFVLTAPLTGYALRNEELPTVADLAMTASEQTAALYSQGAEAIVCILAAPFDAAMAAALQTTLTELGVDVILDGSQAAGADWTLTEPEAGETALPNRPLLPAANGLNGVLRVDLIFEPDGTLTTGAEFLPAATLLEERETMTDTRLTGYNDMVANLFKLAANNAETAANVLFTLKEEENTRTVSFGNYVAGYFEQRAEADREQWQEAAGDAPLYALVCGAGTLPVGEVTRTDLLDALPAGARLQLVKTTWAAYSKLAQSSAITRTYLNGLLSVDTGVDENTPVCLITDTAALRLLNGEVAYTVLLDYGDVYWNIRMAISDATNSFKDSFSLPAAPVIGVGRQ